MSATDHDVVPAAGQFSWGGGVMVFEDADGDPLCSISWQLLEAVAAWVQERKAEPPPPEVLAELAQAAADQVLEMLEPDPYRTREEL